MAGRPKVPLFHYDTKEKNHAYLGKFDNQRELFKMYFDGKIGNLFSGKAYRELPDGTFVVKEQVGRRGLYKLIREEEDPLNWKRKGDKVIELYNSLGEKIGEVANHRVLEALTKTPMQTMRSQLVYGNKNTRIGTPLAKYKDESVSGFILFPDGDATEQMPDVNYSLKKLNSFCETLEEGCDMNYCDDNGCMNRKRYLVNEYPTLYVDQSWHFKKEDEN